MACSNVCSKQAIYFQPDKLGNLQPAIKENICVQCGACEKVCPQLNDSPRNSVSNVFALYTKNKEDCRNCASGGVATTLSRWFIQNQGVVCGVGFSEQGKSVLKLAQSNEELNEFRGSKYVYSEPGDIYRQVKKSIRDGTTVLFIGTPCQVDACKRVVGDSTLLYTVGLICHGTPPYQYLQDHFKSNVQNFDLVKSFSFRGMYDFFLCAYDREKQLLYRKAQQEDAYFTAFMEGIIHRESCYQCKYANASRVEDITIGDFWGIGKEALNRYPGKISVALCNTEKGLKLFQHVCNCFEWEERTLQEAIAGNDQLREPTKRPKNRKAFCDAYLETKNFSIAIKRTEIPKKNRKAILRRYLLAVPKMLRNQIRNRI